MKSQVRLLPHLNSLYDQKKSYQVHRQKIRTIRRSISSSKKSLQLNQSVLNNQNQQDNVSNCSYIKPFMSQQKSKSNMNKMQTIQQVKDISYWMKKMNPYQKRLKQEQIKQNKRLRQKIKNSVSWVNNKNNIQLHDEKFSLIKSRLLRYHNNNQSNITSLKCETVFKRITQIQKQKMKTQQSRIKMFTNLNQSRQSQINEKFLSKQLLPKQIKTTKQIQQSKNLLNKRYLNSNKTELLKFKKDKFKIVDYSSRSSLSNIKQIPKMPMIQQRNIKTQIQEQRLNQKNIQQKYKPIVNRELINRSKLSKLSTKSYLSEQNSSKSLKNINANRNISKQLKTNLSPRVQTKLKFVTSYQYQKSRSCIKNIPTNSNNSNRKLMPTIRLRNKPQNSQRSFSLSQKKTSLLYEQKSLASHNSLMKKIDFQRKKIERFYNYKSSYMSNYNNNNKIINNNNNLSQKYKINDNSIKLIQTQRSRNGDMIVQEARKIQSDKLDLDHDKHNAESNNCFATEITS